MKFLADENFDNNIVRGLLRRNPDIDIPGFGLHPLKGQQKGRWSIKVNGNWRLTFEFRDGDVFVLDYEDYH
jgi:plasmid maintenance system killer protein